MQPFDILYSIDHANILVISDSNITYPIQSPHVSQPIKVALETQSWLGLHIVSIGCHDLLVHGPMVARSFEKSFTYMCNYSGSFRRSWARARSGSADFGKA
jgi:hypothetical protein